MHSFNVTRHILIHIQTHLRYNHTLNSLKFPTFLLSITSHHESITYTYVQITYHPQRLFSFYLTYFFYIPSHTYQTNIIHTSYIHHTYNISPTVPFVIIGFGICGSGLCTVAPIMIYFAGICSD